ncbi:MAG: hypothetical protein HRT82_06880 [Henriciella sp.]|nr:hypothetical protein [Henriciella sp.]
MGILKLAGLVGVSVLLGAATAAADKTCYGVAKMQYINKGGYTVSDFYVMYKDENGDKQEGYRHRSDLTVGETVLIDLTLISGPPSVGDEVWGKLAIEGGDRNGCRKDGTKFYYDKSGGTISYKSGGTTLNNNRCKLNRRPDDKKIIDCP